MKLLKRFFIVTSTSIVVGASMLISQLTCAATSAINDRSALIIGVSKYESPEVPSLAGVPFDVESAKTISKAMGIPDSNITVLRDQEATKENILNSLKKFSDKAASGGRVFIYYSGHGTRWYDPSIGGCQEGLLTYERQTVTNAEIAEATKKLNQGTDKTIIMMDACHSGKLLTSVGKTRSLTEAKFEPKFYPKNSIQEDTQYCSRPTNMKTRSLFSETTRLGALQENVVMITSARPDEVSFDEPGRGGVATQAVKDCLLGGAKDLNASGGISLDEIRECSQDSINKKLTGPTYTPHHLTVSGNRNLIPVVNAAPVMVAELSKPSSPVNPVPGTKPSAPVVSTPSASPVMPTAAAPTKPLPVPVAAVTPAPPPKPAPDKPLASLATLSDVVAQSNPRRVVDVKLSKSTLKINKDYLELDVKSNHDGYLYLVLLGSDQKSFYLLFPNRLDQNNQIKAGQTIKIPSDAWRVKAAGPAGVDSILVMVADNPRDLANSSQLTTDKNSPFVYALSDSEGRTALINYLTGKSGGSSEMFAAKIVKVSEVP